MIYFYFILWLIFSILISVLLGKSVYNRCHKHLRFEVNWNFLKEADKNERRKLKITVKNNSIHKVLIREVGIYNKDLNEYYSFHKLIDKSSPLPTWLEKEKSILFIQYVADIPVEFKDHRQHLKIYAKDSQGRTYF